MNDTLPFNCNFGTVNYDPFANMHEPVESKIEWLAQNNYQVAGVVHVGANDGKELAWYVTKNYRPILAFEPHPEAFKELYSHYWNHALLWPLALGSSNGKIKLNIPADGNTERSSKYLPIPTQGHDWTKVPMADAIEVEMSRFDVWVWKGGIDLAPFNALVIDVQGMELEVLDGFGIYLPSFQFLIVECSRNPVYTGEPSAQEVILWLKDKGFKAMTPVEEHDDIIFIRNDLIVSTD